jgi:hypothetical protein
MLVRDIVCNRTYGNSNVTYTVMVSSVVLNDDELPAKVTDGEEIPDLLN